MNPLHRPAAIAIDLEPVAGELETEGVSKVVQPFEETLAALEAARSAALSTPGGTGGGAGR